MRRFTDPGPTANLIWVDAADSTNDWADRMMQAALEADDAPLPDTVLLAGEQTGGHGRGANAWVSPRGGLYATWMGRVSPEALPVLPLAVGVACAEAVEAVVEGVTVGLKWPNDLVVGGRKLGGMLCRARSSEDDVWVRVGFGINLAVTPVLAQGDPVRPVALAELGWRGDAGSTAWALVGHFLDRVRRALAGPDRTRELWHARIVHRAGESLRVRLEHTVLDGQFAGFTPEGHLELLVNGQVERVAAGELVAGDPGGGGEHAAGT